MAKKDSVVDALLTMAALLGGAYLSVEILKLFATKKIMYNCPTCSHDVEYGQDQCPQCKSYLLWPTD